MDWSLGGACGIDWPRGRAGAASPGERRSRSGTGSTRPAVPVVVAVVTPEPLATEEGVARSLDARPARALGETTAPRARARSVQARGQPQCEARALALLALDSDFAAQQLGEPEREGESETGAAVEPR